MRYHLHSYGMKNEKELSKLLSGALKKRNLDFSTYLSKMLYCTTCGYEITLLLLSRMLNVDIVVIRPDFVWLSRSVAPITCQIVIVQDVSGNFLGTKMKNPVYIGLVLKILLPDPNFIRSKLHEIRHQSTPNRPIRSQNESFRQFGAGISPIVDMGSQKSRCNKEVVARQNLLAEESSSSTSASTSLMRCQISTFQQHNFSQNTEQSDETNDLSTTIDPNEAFAEDGQQNDIESSRDQDNTPTSDTKDESGDMSGTFDVGCTDSSTLVENESKRDQDTTTTTAEEDKTETADPSGENSDSGDIEYNDDDEKDENGSDGEQEEGSDESTKQIEQSDGDNDDDDKDEKGSDGEQEEWSDESTKQIEQFDGDNDDDDNDENGSDGEQEERSDDSMNRIELGNGDNRNEEKDDKSADDEGDKMVIDAIKKKDEEKKSDVNMAKNDISINSDDIIPRENTVPDGNNSSMTPLTMEMSHGDTTKQNRKTKMGPSSTIQTVDIGQTQKTEEGKTPARKRRIGMGGPAFTKKNAKCVNARHLNRF